MDRFHAASDVARSAGRAALIAAAGMIGVLAVHHPMIFSGFRRIQTDLADTRLLNYFLVS